MRACGQRSSIGDLVQEAAYSNNIIRGSHLASSFELMYDRFPRISGSSVAVGFPLSIKQNNENIAQRKIQDYAALERSGS